MTYIDPESFKDDMARPLTPSESLRHRIRREALTAAKVAVIFVGGMTLGGTASAVINWPV